MIEIVRRTGTIAMLLLTTGLITWLDVSTAAGESFTGSRKDIVAYVHLKVNVITDTEGSPSLQTRLEKYPVLYVDVGGRCEFFLKNPRQDITRGSQMSERVYFKDVTAIRSLKSASSSDFGLNVYVGNKAYPVRKWSGMAAIKDDRAGGVCANLSDKDFRYAWPTLHLKVINASKQVQWLDADLTNIVEFAYDRSRGRQLYEEIVRNYKNIPTEKRQSSKSFQQLKAEAQAKSESRAQTQKRQSHDEAAALLLMQRTAEFRDKLAEGDDSHCGLVIEVKSKVVKVQTMTGVSWLKRNQLYPAGSKPCNFLNGVYQEPE